MTRETRINLSVAAAASVLALYGAELVLVLHPLPTQAQASYARREGAARAFHLASDPRSGMQVVRDMRHLGIDAWPGFPAGFRPARRPQAEGDSTLQPLAGLSGALTVMCNDFGPWVMYRADEHGFSNPAGQWGLPRADVALIGDSFVQGQCLRAAGTFPALIRARYPRTIAAGIAAAGPLIELGFLREYVAPLRPRVLLWIYYEGNDLTDLEREKRLPVAQRYLEPGFSQHLAARQAEVDARLRSFFVASESAEARNRASVTVPSLGSRLRAGLKLTSLREALRRLRPKPQDPCCDLALFARALRRTAEDTRAWGGRLVFVYLPAQVTLAGGRGARRPGIDAVDSVRAVVRRLDVPLLDLRDSLRNYGSPDSIYRPEGGHLTPFGQRVVADIMLRYLACVDSLTAAPTNVTEAASAPRPGGSSACPPATRADSSAATSRAS